jgi:hypothetical protein
MQFYEKADLAGFHFKDKRDLFQDSLLLILPEDEKDAIGEVDRIINDVLRIKDFNGSVIPSTLNEYSKEWIKKLSATVSPMTLHSTARMHRCFADQELTDTMPVSIREMPRSVLIMIA